jgi:hypothetical protein
MEVVVAASGLGEREVSKLLSELGILGFACHCLNVHEDGRRTPGAYVSKVGWEYLTTGTSKTRTE